MKRDISDLHIFGGKKTYPRAKHVGKPNPINRQRFLNRVERILDSGRYTNAGPFVNEFEQRLADFADVRHCVATCNGTTALQIAARALELHGEVIMPSFTFPATAHALAWQHITPVFCDIDPQTCTMDPADVERCITPSTSGILGVHLFGRVCQIEQLHAIAARHRLHLMFDACHALGCSYQGTMIGNFGDAEVFSFHATKFINSFEGGAIATNNDALANKLRLMRNFGSIDLVNVLSVGINGKLTEIAAAMGITSLEDSEAIIRTNRANHFHYEQQLSSLPALSVLPYTTGQQHNFQYVATRLDESRATISRDHMFRILREENILVQRYFHPGVHNLQPYRSNTTESTTALPHTDRMINEVLVFPTGMDVCRADIEQICDVVHFIIDHGEAIGRRMSGKKQRTVG